MKTKVCACGCGCFVVRKQARFISGHNTIKHGATVHGLLTREYRSYRSAKSRCNNSKNLAWKHYGGRGIKFLFTSFEQFFAELGTRPENKTLDRINNDGNYEPGNVRWGTRHEQLSNRRKYGALSCFSLEELETEIARRKSQHS